MPRRANSGLTSCWNSWGTPGLTELNPTIKPGLHTKVVLLMLDFGSRTKQTGKDYVKSLIPIGFKIMVEDVSIKSLHVNIPESLC